MDTELKTQTERQLARIWAEVLGQKDIRRGQDFFAAGGDSLLATKVVLRARRTWNLDLTVRVLLDSPKLEDMAEHIDRLVAGGHARAPDAPSA